MGEVYQHWADQARRQHWSNTMIAQYMGENVMREGFMALRLIHILYPNKDCCDE